MLCCSRCAQCAVGALPADPCLLPGTICNPSRRNLGVCGAPGALPGDALTCYDDGLQTVNPCAIDDWCYADRIAAGCRYIATAPGGPGGCTLETPDGRYTCEGRPRLVMGLPIRVDCDCFPLSISGA